MPRRRSHLFPMPALLAIAATAFVITTKAQELVVPGGFRSSDRIPIAIEGLSGEDQRTLSFDLNVQGFETVARSRAAYVVDGRRTDRLEAQVRRVIGESADVLFARAYVGPGSTPVHALADEIVESVTGRKGISQTKIAYRVQTDGVSEIAVADFNGQNEVVVTRDHSFAREPAWVPGQSGLVYTSLRLGNQDLYFHDLKSGKRDILARYPGLNTGGVPSPDGKRLTLILSRSGNPELYVADIRGNGVRQLTRTSELEVSPTWSADSRRIAFVSRHSGRSHLWVVGADGGEMRRIQTAGVFNATEPDWSPDGSQIAFTTQSGSRFEICVVPAGGGPVTRLVEGEDPSWAPNSRNLIFTRRSGRDRYLSILDVPTKHVEDIRKNSGSRSQPVWGR